VLPSSYFIAHGEAARRLVRVLVEGISAFKANREAALRALEKYTRLTDRNIFDPKEFPQAKNANPKDFFDNSFVDNPESTGFLRSIGFGN
jgi:hypothetical protein